MRSMRPLIALLLAGAAGLAVPVDARAAAGPPPAPAPALRLDAGSVARHRVVAVGRDVLIAGEALAGVTALDGNARISGTVIGDVTILGGSAELESTAVLRGEVFILGGELHAAPGARLEGRSVVYPSVSRAWMTLLEGPSLGLSAAAPVVLAAKLALAAAWLVLTLLIFGSGSRPACATSDEVRREPFACFAAGLVSVLAATLTVVFLGSLLPPVVAVPLLALVVLGALLAKLWGMVAVFHALGVALAARLAPGRRVAALHLAVLGLLVLALIKFAPVVGLWAWTAATLVGVGAALRTKFGRGEAWFPEPLSESALSTRV